MRVWQDTHAGCGSGMLWVVRKVKAQRLGEGHLLPPKLPLSPGVPPPLLREGLLALGHGPGSVRWECGCSQKEVCFCHRLLVSALPCTVPLGARGFHCPLAGVSMCSEEVVLMRFSGRLAVWAAEPSLRPRSGLTTPRCGRACAPVLCPIIRKAPLLFYCKGRHSVKACDIVCDSVKV